MCIRDRIISRLTSDDAEDALDPADGRAERVWELEPDKGYLGSRFPDVYKRQPVGSSHADAMLFKGHVAPDVLKHLFGVDRSIAVGSLAQIGSGSRGGSRCPGSLGGRGNGHRGSYGRRRRGIERRNLGVVIVRRDERIVIRRHVVFPRLAIGIYVTLREDRGAASVILSLIHI